ncbi:MAG: hypothetical protein SFV54_28875 [Bryobacteraceae bacterium]|nr:hypothetical protein [Bryobacteraceae bacterium]
MQCLYCGKRIAILRKLTQGEFCSDAHKRRYHQEQEQLGLARLIEAQQRLAENPAASPGNITYSNLAAYVQAAGQAGFITEWPRPVGCRSLRQVSLERAFLEDDLYRPRLEMDRRAVTGRFRLCHPAANPNVTAQHPVPRVEPVGLLVSVRFGASPLRPIDERPRHETLFETLGLHPAVTLPAVLASVRPCLRVPAVEFLFRPVLARRRSPLAPVPGAVPENGVLLRSHGTAVSAASAAARIRRTGCTALDGAPRLWGLPRATHRLDHPLPRLSRSVRFTAPAAGRAPLLGARATVAYQRAVIEPLVILGALAQVAGRHLTLAARVTEAELDQRLSELDALAERNLLSPQLAPPAPLALDRPAAILASAAAVEPETTVRHGLRDVAAPPCGLESARTPSVLTVLTATSATRPPAPEQRIPVPVRRVALLTAPRPARPPVLTSAANLLSLTGDRLGGTPPCAFRVAGAAALTVYAGETGASHPLLPSSSHTCRFALDPAVTPVPGAALAALCVLRVPASVEPKALATGLHSPVAPAVPPPVPSMGAAPQPLLALERPAASAAVRPQQSAAAAGPAALPAAPEPVETRLAARFEVRIGPAPARRLFRLKGCRPDPGATGKRGFLDPAEAPAAKPLQRDRGLATKPPRLPSYTPLDRLRDLYVSFRSIQLPSVPVWRLAPVDLKWLALALPVLIGLAITSRVWQGGPAKAEPGPSAAAAKEQPIWARQVTALRQNIMRRAAISLNEDFRSGLSEWQGAGDWARTWSFDSTGFAVPGALALYSPSLSMSDYTLDFLAMIDRRALSWVVRAADYKNYEAVKIAIVKPGPLTQAALVHYSVVNGREQRSAQVPIPIQLRSDTLYKVRMQVVGNDYSVSIQGQMVHSWTNSQFTRGGIGFFSGKGEQSRLRWVEVSHQYDALGRLCAFLAPYSVQAKDGSWK